MRQHAPRQDGCPVWLPQACYLLTSGSHSLSSAEEDRFDGGFLKGNMYYLTLNLNYSDGAFAL